jgi:hypothetical protein
MVENQSTQVFRLAADGVSLRKMEGIRSLPVFNHFVSKFRFSGIAFPAIPSLKILCRLRGRNRFLIAIISAR